MSALHLQCFRTLVLTHHRFLPIIILILSSLLTTFTAHMQASLITDTIIFVREADTTLDEDLVVEMMTPLAERGVSVAAYFVQTGDAADFLQRLQADGLGNGRAANRNVIAVYAAVNSQYSEIRWGEDYDIRLRALNLRSDIMNPALRAGDYTKAFADTFNAIETVLAGGRPPVSTRAPAQPANQDLPTGVDFGVLAFGVMIVIGLGRKIYCAVTGNCQSSRNNDTDTSSSSVSTSSGAGWFSGGGDSNSSSDSGGSDGGSWSD